MSQCSQDPWFVEHFSQEIQHHQNSSRSLQTPVVDREKLLRFKQKLFPGRPVKDGKITELTRMSERLDCALMASASSLSCDPFFPGVMEHESLESDSEVWGLGCRDNRSLNFYVLDSTTQWSLVQRLHGDHKVPQQPPKAVIISLNDDKIFAMDQELSSQNLQNFLRAFHADNRDLEVEEGSGLRLVKLSKPIKKHKNSEILEINAANFVQKLVTSNRNVSGNSS